MPVELKSFFFYLIVPSNNAELYELDFSPFLLRRSFFRSRCQLEVEISFSFFYLSHISAFLFWF